MIYVMIRAELVEAFSRGLARLMRPSHLRNASYITDLYCPFIVHPSNGWAVLLLPHEEIVPIHLQADGIELSELLSIFVRDESITHQEAQGIGEAVFAMRGNKVRIADFIPPSWSQSVLTEKQAIDQGFILQEKEPI